MGRVVAGWMALGALVLAFILIPFFLWEDRALAATLAFLEAPHARWEIATVLAGLLAADIVLPAPSSLVNTAAGSLLGFWGGTAASWTGLMVGAVVGYVIGRRASATALRRLVGDSTERVAQATERYGHWGLVMFRAVPVLAEASVLVAGFNRLSLRRFLVSCALSNLGIAATYSAIGAYAAGTSSFLLAFAGAVLVPALAMLLVRRLWAWRSAGSGRAAQ